MICLQRSKSTAAVSAVAGAGEGWSAAGWAGPAAAKDKELLDWLQEQYQAAATHHDHFSCQGPAFDRVRPQQPASAVTLVLLISSKDSSLDKAAHLYPQPAGWHAGSLGPQAEFLHSGRQDDVEDAAVGRQE
jgi:hypothetical protein